MYQLLLEKLRVANVVADVLVSHLYKLMAENAAANASLLYEEMRRFTTSDVERRICDCLDISDITAIDDALRSGWMVPVDLSSPTVEPGFYQGVKVNPGHVVAGLVLDRPKETKNIVRQVQFRRQVLVSGPSGAGKSALVWMAVSSMRSTMRWYQVTTQAGPSETAAIIRFIRSRRPSNASPIGLVFDDLADVSTSLWNALCSDLRGLPGVSMLGSIRNEDLDLITNRAEVAVVAAELDGPLARNLWESLDSQDKTTWQHWREPFEESNCLMLEYMHLLTYGKRLKELIRDQVHQRVKEDRQDELAILRCTSAINSHGGEVTASTLFQILGMPLNRAYRALQRLLDEHLVRESSEGMLGGLHRLRSQALLDASHDEIVYLQSQSLWKSLPATSVETLPAVIRSILREVPLDAVLEPMQRLADTLGISKNVAVWTAILTGLGWSTLHQHAIPFMQLLRRREIPPIHWGLACLYLDPLLGESESVEGLRRLHDAAREFQANSKPDLRAQFLRLLPTGAPELTCTDPIEANRLLAALVPLGGGDSISLTVIFDFACYETWNVDELASLLATATMLQPAVVEDILKAVGGELRLLKLFKSQTPWVTVPLIEVTDESTRTIKTDWFYVSEQYQPDPNKAIFDICTTLLSLSPFSHLAAVDATDPTGQPLDRPDGAPLCSKRIARKYLVPKARTAWLYAFRQVVYAQMGPSSLTEYTHKMALLIKKTELLFQQFNDGWILGKDTQQSTIAQIDELASQVLETAHPAADITPAFMTNPVNGQSLVSPLSTLLLQILNNLVPRMSNLRGETYPKAISSFAGGLSGRAREQMGSEIWRTMSSPPMEDLDSLATRLYDISSILHEKANSESLSLFKQFVKTARRKRVSNIVQDVAQQSNTRGERRLQHRLKRLVKESRAHGLAVHHWKRPIEQAESPFWPPFEIALGVNVASDLSNISDIERIQAIGQENLGNNWPFRVVPVVDGQIESALAVLPLSVGALPDTEFTRNWEHHIDLPFVNAEISRVFDEAIAACRQQSEIASCRNLADLHPEEARVLANIEKKFRHDRDTYNRYVESTELDDSFGLAQTFIEEVGAEIEHEVETSKSGMQVDDPFWLGLRLNPEGEDCEGVEAYIYLLMLLRQAELGRQD